MSYRTETDYRTTHASAYRRGHECAAICEGDTERQRNPYRKYTDDWRAFNVGWNAWVGSVLAERGGGMMHETDKAIERDEPLCSVCGMVAIDVNDPDYPLCVECATIIGAALDERMAGYADAVRKGEV